MKFILIIILFSFYSVIGFAQKKQADSIFLSFEKTLVRFFKKEYRNIDSSYTFFYGNKFNPFMELVPVDVGAGKYYTNTYTEPPADSINNFDSSYRPFFYRGMSFDQFMNYMIQQGPSTNCVLRKEKGVWIFVDCSMENWQHFYFDKLLYSDGFYVTPIVDVLMSDGSNMHHSRYIFNCCFTLSKGFRILKKYQIRSGEICK